MGSPGFLEREVFAVVGAAAGLAGVILGMVWIRDLLGFLRFGFAVCLVGVGVWLLGRALGVNWAAVRERAGAAIGSVARGSGWRGPAAQWRCPRCGTVVEGAWRYCRACGGELSWQTCTSCGGTQLGDARFCGFCGHPLRAQ